jgi:hypothetical protein
LIERAGARKLSVGFNKALDSIVEVSLVKSPRIGDAKIFCFETDTTTNVEIFMDWSIDSLMSMIYEAISSESEDMYYGFINKMYPDTNDKGEVIYSCNGKDYKYSYTVVNNKIEMSNKQEVVMPSDGWMPIDNEEDDGDNSNGGFTMTDLERLDALEAENAKLKAENAKTSNLLFDTLADNIVGKYKAEGKITPASEKFAKAILMGGIDSTITFEE